MARDRKELHEVLNEIVDNVYFQSPANVRMKYPCIRYQLSGIPVTYASNDSYITNKSYTLTFITRDPDDKRIDRIANLRMCSFDRFYSSDGLNHYIYTIQF